MPGFQNDTLFAGNVDFTGNITHPTPQVTADGQLLIGATVAPNIRVGTLTSLDSSVTITPTAGSIDLSAASVPPVNEDQIFYVAKSGNDANSGRTIAQAFLTFGAAITGRRPRSGQDHHGRFTNQRTEDPWPDQAHPHCLSCQPNLPVAA